MAFRKLRDPLHRAATIALHSVMLILLVAVCASIELRELFPKRGNPRAEKPLSMGSAMFLRRSTLKAPISFRCVCTTKPKA